MCFTWKLNLSKNIYEQENSIFTGQKVFLNQNLIKDQEYILNILLEIITWDFANANPIICEIQLLKFYDFLGHFVKI